VVIRSQIRIPDHFSISLTIAEQWILGDLLAFIIQSPSKLDEMTHADKRMNLLHFGRDPADILIQIRINLESGFESRITFA